jgi:penicillin-binding protein 2
LVTASAALETNLIDVDTSWYCCGYVEFAHRKYWCANRNGHGHLSTTKAIQKSCNTAFFDIGKKISIDVLANYAHRFGLGEKTNILFPEKEGLVPNYAWKKSAKGENWWPGETLSAAIGQSYLLATPIQVARMISAIFTRYLANPRLLMTEPIVKKPLDIKPETIEILQSSMGRVTDQGGTAQSVKRIKDMKIYAKTSTAQTANLDKRELGGAYLEHGWFAGYFQYKDHKPLTIVIVVENIGSSRVTTAIAKSFFIAYKKMIDETSA